MRMDLDLHTGTILRDCYVQNYGNVQIECILASGVTDGPTSRATWIDWLVY